VQFTPKIAKNVKSALRQKYPTEQKNVK